MQFIRISQNDCGKVLCIQRFDVVRILLKGSLVISQVNGADVALVLILHELRPLPGVPGHRSNPVDRRPGEYVVQDKAKVVCGRSQENHSCPCNIVDIAREISNDRGDRNALHCYCYSELGQVRNKDVGSDGVHRGIRRCPQSHSHCGAVRIVQQTVRSLRHTNTVEQTHGFRGVVAVLLDVGRVPNGMRRRGHEAHAVVCGIAVTVERLLDELALVYSVDQRLPKCSHVVRIDRVVVF